MCLCVCVLVSKYSYLQSEDISASPHSFKSLFEGLDLFFVTLVRHILTKMDTHTHTCICVCVCFPNGCGAMRLHIHKGTETLLKNHPRLCRTSSQAGPWVGVFTDLGS